MRVHVLGGFLGAGKTSGIRAAARLLQSRGERVAVVTNDQGYSLVDTALCEEVADQVVEIGGGCFCCRYDLLEDALDAAIEGGATVALAEAVGSCTDLVATVLAPLADRRPELEVAPLSVLVDPYRAAEIREGAFPDEVVYLFQKQIEEADVVVLTRTDLSPPDAETFIRSLRSDVPIVRISSVTDQGIGPWLDQLPERVAAPLNIDYDTYAAAEALLGWGNGRATVTGAEPFDPRRVVLAFFAALTTAPVAHLKVRVSGGGGHLVRAGQAPVLTLEGLPDRTRHLDILVNARIAVDPAQLETLLVEAMEKAAAPARAQWTDLQCFEPGRPVPIHRYPTRDALTLEMAAELALSSGDHVLDVRSREGRGLRAVLEAYPVHGVGLDPKAVAGPAGDRLTLLNGHPHRIAMPNGCFAAVMGHGALSELSAPAPAVAEMYRVLKPGGRLGLCEPPDALPACAALLTSAGFDILVRRDAFLIAVKDGP